MIAINFKDWLLSKSENKSSVNGYAESNGLLAERFSAETGEAADVCNTKGKDKANGLTGAEAQADKFVGFGDHRHGSSETQGHAPEEAMLSNRGLSDGEARANSEAHVNGEAQIDRLTAALERIEQVLSAIANTQLLNRIDQDMQSTYACMRAGDLEQLEEMRLSVREKVYGIQCPGNK